MAKKDKKIDIKMVKSVNKNVRSSVRKLKPILKSIVGKKLMLQLEIYLFLKREFQKMLKKQFLLL